MDTVWILVRQIFQMFLLAGLGFALYRGGKISKEGSKALANILIYLALPATIINGFLVERTPEHLWGILWSGLVAAVLLLLSAAVSRLVFRKDPVAAFAGAFSNPGFFGIPLIIASAGQEAVFYVACFIGLLNIGAEETKGTELQKQTYALLRSAQEAGRINFIGNVESRDVLGGGVDVVVCDGFSGNILLKSIEGTAMMLMKQLKGIFYKNTLNKLAAGILKKDVYGLKAMFDAGEVGGTALLGISKPVIKAHGSSNARAIRSAVKQAMTFIEAGVIESIEKNVQYMRITGNEGE